MRLGLANCDGPKTRPNKPWEGNLSAENSGSAPSVSSAFTGSNLSTIFWNLLAEARSSNGVEDCLPSSRYSTCMSVLPSMRVPARSDAMRGARTKNVDATLMGKESWPERAALTSFSCVELPGIEPVAKILLTCVNAEFHDAKRRKREDDLLDTRKRCKGVELRGFEPLR